MRRARVATGGEDRGRSRMRGRPMGIVFFCQSCGSQVRGQPAMAGKKGRCRKCGQYTRIPRTEEIASMAAMPALAAAGAGAGGRAAGARPVLDDGGPSIGAWLKAGISQVAPGTAHGRRPDAAPPDQAIPARRRRGLQALRPGQARSSTTGARSGSRTTSLVRLWRREIGGRPEGLPLAERQRLLRLDPVPHDPAGRDGREEPAGRAASGRPSWSCSISGGSPPARRSGARPAPRRPRPRGSSGSRSDAWSSRP